MQAVVFDMDGVIVDSEVHWDKLFTPLLEKIAPKFHKGNMAMFVGLNRHDTYNLITNSFGATLSAEEYNTQMDAIAKQVYSTDCQLLPGFLDLVNELNEQNYPMGLASSSVLPSIHMVLDRFELRKYFRSVVSSDTVGGRGKPNPAIYLQAVAEIGSLPERSLAIEDSAKGVQSAKHAGLFCVGLKNGYNSEQDLSSADVVVNGLEDLTVQKLKDYIYNVRQSSRVVKQ